MRGSGLPTKVIERIFDKYNKSLPLMHKIISDSFLPSEMQDALIKIIDNNINSL